MENSVEVNFKHVPFSVVFEHGGVIYTKTNFKKGYYFKDGRKVFRTFKNKTVVTTNRYCFVKIPAVK